MAKEVKRFVVFHDGTKKEITDETGKYWICKKFQIRKLSTSIAEIREEEIAPKKKPAKKKAEVEFEEGFEKIPEVEDIEAEEIQEGE